MAPTKKLIQTVELTAPLVPQEAKHLMVTGDNNANTIILHVEENGKPADLTGCNAVAYMIRPGDDEKPYVNGKVEGSTVTVCLNAGFYAKAGRYTLLVRLTHTDGTKCTLLCMNGWADSEGNGEPIDTGNAMPNLDDLLAQIAALETATTKAEAVANMTVEAMTLPAGNTATAEFKGNKLTLGIPKGLDSETALPLGYKPNDMLVIGPDGKPRWEKRTHYDYGGTVLPLTDLKLVGGMCTFTEPFDNIPQVGVPYHVTYFGYDYDLIAKEWIEDGKTCVTLGNQKDLGGTDWTQEPFVIVFYPEKDELFGTYGYFSCSATNKETMAVSIEGAGELKKIDPKFLGVFALIIERKTEDRVNFSYKPSHNSTEVYEGVMSGKMTGAWFSTLNEETSPLPMFTPLKILNVTDSGTVFIDENAQKVFTLINGTFSEVSST